MTRSEKDVTGQLQCCAVISWNILRKSHPDDAHPYN